MKAIIFEKFGAPNVLKQVEIEKPSPKKDEILVKIHASSVTAEDPKMRSFNHPPLLKIPVGLIFGFKKPKKPILGMEFSGIVEKVGTSIKLYKPGDKVYGYTGISFGAHAEYKCISEKSLIHYVPDNLNYEESATMVNGFLTALTYLKKKGKIKKGDNVLIYGASGSVGVAAVQLAKYFGAKVTGVCSTKNIDLVNSIGADHVIDYTQEDFTCINENYDIIFDTVGKTSMKSCLNLLNPGGRYLLTEFNLLHILYNLFTSLFRNQKIIGVASNFYWKKEDLILLNEIAESGNIKPVIDRTYPLEKIIEAHQYVESGRKAGNVAITI